MTTPLVHRCGHAFEPALHDAVKLADAGYLDWVLDRECRACWFKRRQVATDVAVKKATRMVDSGQWPALHSHRPALLAWAERERVRILTGMDRLVRERPGWARKLGIEETRAWALTKTEASFWIDSRGHTPATFIRLRFKQAHADYSTLFRKRA